LAIRRSRSIAIWILLLAALVFTRARRGRTRDREAATPQPAIADGRYKPSVQEGLGASVAILLDQSGSMKDPPKRGGGGPKFAVAREAIERVLAQTDSFVATQTGFPVNVGLYAFSGSVHRVLPIARYDRNALRQALSDLPRPTGSTAIGDAMLAATSDLYSAGTIRKYLLVVTDGQNTDGRDPADAAREIQQRSEGAVRLYLVAFDVDAEKFGFVSEVHGTVLEAQDAVALRASLDTLYRGRILAEAVDAGERLPAPLDSARRKPAPDSSAPPPRQR
jgi:Mg-chelatase subunit ChlD